MHFRIGDKLISVNERMVDGGTHKDAVHALKAAGMEARMVSVVMCCRMPPFFF